MPGISITHWTWLKRPDAKIENGLIIEGTDQPEPYHPGEDITGLLNAVQGIYDEQSALEFVKHWGLLGLLYNAPASNDLRSQINGAFTFTYAARKKDNPGINKDVVMQEVIQFFNPNGGFCLTPKGDSLSSTINFAQWVRYIAEVKRLLTLYQDDKIAAAYETKEWLNNLPPQWYKKIVVADINILKEQYGPAYDEPSFFEYVLDIALGNAREIISSRLQRGVWIGLYRSPFGNHPQGYPVLNFDGLFRFIAYVLLVHGVASPKKCADPKCGRLFFPAKADQKYCPPPPGVRRSRCENRHGQWLRRHGIKNKKGEMVNAKSKKG